jgi:hypothetical protein
MEIGPLSALAGSGQTAMSKIIYPIFTALALTGCMNGPVSQLSESHPANPASAQASHAPLVPFLMSNTNLVVMTTVSTNAPEHGHEHDAKTKPDSKTPPKHDHD